MTVTGGGTFAEDEELIVVLFRASANFRAPQPLAMG